MWVVYFSKLTASALIWYFRKYTHFPVLIRRPGCSTCNYFKRILWSLNDVIMDSSNSYNTKTDRLWRHRYRLLLYKTRYVYHVIRLTTTRRKVRCRNWSLSTQSRKRRALRREDERYRNAVLWWIAMWWSVFVTIDQRVIHLHLTSTFNTTSANTSQILPLTSLVVSCRIDCLCWLRGLIVPLIKQPSY